MIHAAASGVGLAAVQLCNAFGAIPVGSSRTPGKLQKLSREYGLQSFLRKDDWWVEGAIREVWLRHHSRPCRWDRNGQGLRVLKRGGRVVVVGLTAGVRSEIRTRPPVVEESDCERNGIAVPKR